MKKTFLVIIVSLSLTAAACDLFPQTTAGILKTSNGGVDWQAANTLKANTDLEETDQNSQGTISGLSISKLAFDPQATENIYAGSLNSGLYRSTDGASTWEQVLGQIPVLDFVIHPNDSNTIYAAGYYEERGRALLTKDGGKSWNSVYTAAATNSSVRGIALNPNSPQQVVIGLSSGELILSGDGGATWRLIQSYNDRINKIIWDQTGLYVLVRGTGISKSSDGGNTFQLITSSLQSAGNISSLSIFGDSISAFNQMAISTNNSSNMFVTTNLGLYQSQNGGMSWSFVNMPLKQSTTPPNALALAPSSDNVIYVSAGSIIYKTTDGGYTWSSSDTKVNRLINSILVDPNIPQAAYAGVYIK